MDGAAKSSGNGYLAPITPDLVVEGGQATTENGGLAAGVVAPQQDAGHVGHSRAEIERDFVASRWCDLSLELILLTDH